MSDNPTPDEDAPPADPAPEAVEAIKAGTVAEPAADSDAVEITHDVAPDAPR